MLRPRNFNKLIHKTYSCWRNSTTTFGRQFLQIQNGNGCQSHCNIPFKYPQQLYQRYQFFNGGNEGWVEKRINSHFTLEIRHFELDNSNENVLNLELRKGKSGYKNFRILKLNKFDQNRDWQFTNILVPQDAYAFVRALDELVRALASEEFEQKLLQIKDPQSTNEIVNINNQQQTTQILKLTVELTGLRHNFQLELVLFSNNEICLRLIAAHKVTNKRTVRIFPLHALPWLREQMAELLAKHDGTEEIEKEAPAQIPQKFLQYTYMKN